MPWWAQSNPKWRPPPLANPRPLDRLRDRLNEIIGDDEHGEDWLKSLAERLPAEAIEAFLDMKAMTPGEIRAIAGFVGEFGADMETGRLVRRAQEESHSPRAQMAAGRR
jgi:hypothetical protein